MNGTARFSSCCVAHQSPGPFVDLELVFRKSIVIIDMMSEVLLLWVGLVRGL